MIEVELFKDATFEYKIFSDNVNCPDLNIALKKTLVYALQTLSEAANAQLLLGNKH